LSYLRPSRLDILKIDRSFISEMLTNSESLEIVKTILSLGNNLGMEVVAEGVETLEQMSVLKSLGCEYAQGYFSPSRRLSRDTTNPSNSGSELLHAAASISQAAGWPRGLSA